MDIGLRKLFFIIGLVGALAAGRFGLPAALYERVEQPLQFSHAIHAGDAVGMSCEDCHGFDEQGRFQGIPTTANCAMCHEEALTNTENERRLIDEYVRPGREIPWLVYARQPDNVHFPHAPHTVLADLTCERCHGDHERTASLRVYERNRLSTYSRDIWGRRISGLGSDPPDGMKMSDCSSCHRARGVIESCLDCHK